MNQRLTLVFLILLRTAIGWHFFFEALEKHYSVNIGPSEISRPWSGEGYFREGRGPVAALMRLKLGDLDEQALARMTVRTAAYDEPISKRLPEALDAEWNDYFERFAKHYGLDAQQRQSAQAKLLEQKEKTAVWFIAKVPSYKW